MEVLRSGGVLGRVAGVLMAAPMLVAAACTGDDAMPPRQAQASDLREAAPELFRAPGWGTSSEILTHADVLVALGELFPAGSGAWPGRWRAEAGSDGSCAILPGTLGAAVPWGASVFFTFEQPDGSLGTDVVECTYGPADPKRIARLYAQMEANAPALAGVRYEPAAIGVDAFGWELDGGAGAIDRVVVVTTGESLVGIVANRHSPVAEGDNLTRAQVDALTRTAVATLAAAT